MIKAKLILLFQKIREQKKGFLAYILGIGVFFLFTFLFLVFSHKILRDIGLIVSSLLFTIGVFIDIYEKIDASKNNSFLKIVFFCFFSSYLYFSFYIAESVTKSSIYEIVHENPEFFPTAISIITGLYLIPSFAILFIQFIEAYTILTSLAFLLLCIILMLPSYLKKFFKITNKVIHLVLFLFGVGIAFFNLIDLSQQNIYDNLFGKNFIARILVESSYYQSKTCKPFNGKYIKLLEDNKVSVTNLQKEDISKIHSKSFNKEIIFESKECMKE